MFWIVMIVFILAINTTGCYLVLLVAALLIGVVECRQNQGHDAYTRYEQKDGDLGEVKEQCFHMTSNNIMAGGKQRKQRISKNKNRLLRTDVGDVSHVKIRKCKVERMLCRIVDLKLGAHVHVF